MSVLAKNLTFFLIDILIFIEATDEKNWFMIHFLFFLFGLLKNTKNIKLKK